MNIVEKLVCLQTKGFYKISHLFLSIMGLEIPRQVSFVGGVKFAHRGYGVVIHPKTKIGKNVTIYQGVTIGAARPWGKEPEEGCEIMDDVILCAGAKILFKKDKLIVGKGTVIGANSVLLCSTGEYEIWAGNPARKVGYRNY